jgi:hypothetical protein
MNTVYIQITEEDIASVEWAAALVPIEKNGPLTTFAAKLRAALDNTKFTHTVMCFTDKDLSAHFSDVTQATPYINDLLSQGHKAKLYPYRPKKSQMDYFMEQMEEEEKRR